MLPHLDACLPLSLEPVQHSCKRDGVFRALAPQRTHATLEQRHHVHLFAVEFTVGMRVERVSDDDLVNDRCVR